MIVFSIFKQILLILLFPWYIFATDNTSCDAIKKYIIFDESGEFEKIQEKSLLIISKLLEKSGRFEDCIRYFEEKNKNGFVCDKILDLNPNDSHDKFEKIVTEMRNRNLTVCNCIKYLTTQAIKEVVDKEFPSLSEAEKKAVYQIPNYTGNIGKVHCDANIPSEFCDTVRAMYVGKNDLFVREDNSLSNKNIAYASENNIIGLDTQRSKTLTRSELFHTARHETVHLNCAHVMKGQYLVNTLNNEVSDRSILELIKAQEGQADMIPAACNSLQAARDCEQRLYKLYKDRLYNYQSQEQIKKGFFLSRSFKHIDYDKFSAYEEAFDSEHPASRVSLYWAIVVRKLREIEEIQQQQTK